VWHSGVGLANGVLWDRGLPFALATRSKVIFQVDAAMRERENAFFAARGLKERRS
jgi:hypothetical protein